MKKFFSLMLLIATLCTFAACGGDGDEPDSTKLSQTSYTMYHEATQAVEGSNLSGLEWNSENEFVATVKDNVITGQYVGKTIVKSSTKNLSFSVEIKPKYNMYEEPCMDWGASKSAIIAKYGTPERETSDAILYKTSNVKAPLMVFVFNNGKMTTCGVVCETLSAYELSDFLLERYVPVKVDVDNYTATVLHCYGKISDPQADYGAVMEYSSSIDGILVAYTGLDKTTKAHKIDSINFDAAFKSIENIAKNLR